MSATGPRPFLSDRVISVLSPLILLGFWEICARAGLVDVRFFPAPSNVIRHLVAMIGSGDLWRHLAASLYRLFVGFFVGCVPAIVIGLAIGLYRPVRAALDPLISATYPIPKSSLLPKTCRAGPPSPPARASAPTSGPTPLQPQRCADARRRRRADFIFFTLQDFP